MDFIEQCKAQLMQRFGLSARQLQAEHVLINTDAAALHVEFHPPSETVSVYASGSQPVARRLGELPLPEQYIALRGVMETNAELFRQSLLRLYLDGSCLGVAANCSPLNCRDAPGFAGVLQDVLVVYKNLDNIETIL